MGQQTRNICNQYFHMVMPIGDVTWLQLAYRSYGMWLNMLCVNTCRIIGNLGAMKILWCPESEGNCVWRCRSLFVCVWKHWSMTLWISEPSLYGHSCTRTHTLCLTSLCWSYSTLARQTWSRFVMGLPVTKPPLSHHWRYILIYHCKHGTLICF